jgi:rhodanese-related sulfurtransferase
MILAPLLFLALIAGITLFLWIKRGRDRDEVARYSISPIELDALFRSGAPVLLYDVRVPLLLLAHSHIIPGSLRLAPHEVLANPSLIPSDQDVILYCTCPSDRTARRVLRRVLDLHFTRIKFLRGGLEAWKAQRLPLAAYDQPFRIDTAF